jgi:hypothetical protein
MKNYIRFIFLLFFQTIGTSATFAQATNADPNAKFNDIISSYQQALNAGNAAGITTLFAGNASSSTNDDPAIAGYENIQHRYDQLFKKCHFYLNFKIVDLLASDSLVYLKIEGTGTVFYPASNDSAGENEPNEEIKGSNPDEWKSPDADRYARSVNFTENRTVSEILILCKDNGIWKIQRQVTGL